MPKLPVPPFFDKHNFFTLGKIAFFIEGPSINVAIEGRAARQSSCSCSESESRALVSRGKTSFLIASAGHNLSRRSTRCKRTKLICKN